jgi:hypothetical protein
MSQIRTPSRQRPVAPFRLASVILSLVLSTMTVAADEDARYAAVKGLGALNGVALQCKYLDQVRRMKSAVVANAPKERSFGLAFDQATNDTFLAFIKDDAACPTHDSLERQIGDQIDVMKAAFGVP